MKTKQPDNRPRFGFCGSIDAEPQQIFERSILVDSYYGRDARRCVAVIPLPFMSAKIKAKVRAFTKTLHP